MTAAESTVLMDGVAVRRAVDRMAHEILERLGGTGNMVLMGIQRRGVDLADMIRGAITGAEGGTVPTGTLDITFYRDDLMALGPRPVVGETELPRGGVDGMAVVLIDDVLYTGRTARAALNELMDWGRPARILLCVLVDRGDRELPIQPDIVGRELPVLANQRVDVLVPRLDGELAVVLSAVESG
ncbi:MAG: bifunctional pyr operon transcriptional regulator/uracil phosphoribosyltransferase PyrR [Gemmatimonadota bacterium]|nr:bifunctional pyr operon transcriptional regulator/uracil phosphoribosyltransferase PyrR [Gemmatimonadota bacterium]